MGNRHVVALYLFLPWCLARIEWSVSKIFYLGWLASLFLILWLKEAGFWLFFVLFDFFFCGGFLIFACFCLSAGIYFLVAGSFNAKLGTRGKKKMQGMTNASPLVSDLTCLLLSTFHSLGCAQSGLTLCDPMDCSPPDSSVYGLLQARMLEWVAISYSRRSSWSRDRTHIPWVSCTGRILDH